MRRIADWVAFGSLSVADGGKQLVARVTSSSHAHGSSQIRAPLQPRHC
jgi:hypothetical protein